jgi:Prenyltransferase and squalene oxidase repeat
MVRIGMVVFVVALRLCWGASIAVARENETAAVHAAVKKSVSLLQQSGPIFVKKGGCTSCHHQSLPAMAFSLARERGFQVDEQLARDQLEAVAAFLRPSRERMLQGVAIGGAADTVSYSLLGMAAWKYPPDGLTDAMSHYLKATQAGDGHWRTTSHRPPMEYNEITTTALSLRALQIYSPDGQRAELQERLERGTTWLLKSDPRATEERAFKLLGLSWMKAGSKAIQKAARELLATQRPDGGWSQLSTLESDAYATGQALVALHQGGSLPVTDPAYVRGVKFLLKTQLDDGSWHVRSRSLPFQPYFESGFPHGDDQWISAAATSWAAMALILTVEPHN